MNRDALSIQLLGYEVRTDDDAVVGEVEGVRPHGMRLAKITGHPGHHGTFRPRRSEPSTASVGRYPWWPGWPVIFVSRIPCGRTPSTSPSACSSPRTP